MLNLNGDIIWYNKSFEKLFAVNDANGSNLVSVVRGIALDKVLKCDKIKKTIDFSIIDDNIEGAE